MLTDRELRSEFVTALEEVTPAAPWLAASIERAATGRARRRRRIDFGFRISQRLVAAALLIALILSGMAVFLAIHHAATNVVPAGHGHSVTTPSGDWGMVSATTGWQETTWFDTDGWHHILRTTDGGSHWKDVTPPAALTNGVSPAETPWINAGHYILDRDHLWIAEPVVATVAPSQCCPIAGFVPFVTADGGATWRRGAVVPASGYPITNVYFLDSEHGWLLINQGIQGQTFLGGTLFATTDGGLDWKPLDTRLNGVESSCGATGISFESIETGWVSVQCEVQQLLVTHDGGSTWSNQPLLVAADETLVGPPIVLDKNHALFLVDNGQLARRLLMTSDAGGTWSARSLPGEAQIIVNFVDFKHGWTVAGPSSWFLKTTNGLPSVPGLVLPLYHTDDGGLTWSRVQTTELIESSQGRVSDLYFVDQRNGFLERVNATTQQTFLFRTTDGGQTWALVGRMPPR